MGWLLLLGLIIWLIIRWSRGNSSPSADQQLEQRNYEWAQFIARYKTKAKTKAERAVVDKMLADIAKQGLPIPADIEVVPQPGADYIPENPKLAYTSVAAPAGTSMVSESSADPEPVFPGPVLVQQQRKPVDSGLILLYFGAFLFLGAVGLFLAFGNLPGAAKSTLVAMLVVLFYGTGQWLFHMSKRLKQGGGAFIGIALILLPFFGLSLHIDTFGQQNGPLVWGLTSVLAIMLYWHALMTTRQAYVTYSMLAAVVSLFESSVAISNMPTYYFALAMAAVSIIFLIISKMKKDMRDLQEPLIVSANVLLPFSLLMSLLYIANNGLMPLALALLLSSAFYGVYAWETKPNERTALIVLSNYLGLAGISTLAYSMTSEAEIIAPILVLLAAFQLSALAILRHSKQLAARTYNALMFVVASAPLVGCLFAWSNPALLAIVLLASTAIMVSVHTLTRDPGYIAAAVCLLFIWVPILGAYLQSWEHDMFVIAWGALAVLFFGQRIRHASASPLGRIYRAGYLIALGLIVLFGVFGGWQLAAGSMGLVAAVLLLLDRYERREAYILISVALQYAALFGLNFGLSGIFFANLTYLWAGLATLHYIVARLRPSRYTEIGSGSAIIGSFMGACNVFSSPDSTLPMLGGALLFACINIAEYLRKQDSTNLVLSLIAQYISLIWACTLLPDRLQLNLTPLLFMIVAMLQYGISLMTSKDRPLLIYACLVGLAMGAASGLIFSATVLPMVINLILFSVVAFAEGRRARDVSLVVLSIIAQYVLVLWLSTWQHAVEDALLVPLGLSLYALGQYLVYRMGALRDFEAEYYKNASIVGLTIGALSVMVFSETRLPMILSLAGLGAVVYLEADKNSIQSRRETGLAIIMLAFQWWLYIADVRELQVYTHLWVALLIAFAMWRSGLGQPSQEKSYVIWALSVLSAPLLLQALGDSGQTYGWLLIIEHILMMIIGIAVRRRYVMWWGLAVSTVAVLYQLRDLAFVALGFLAVVVIGIALYILGRQNNTKS